MREKSKQYREANKEKQNERKKQYYEANKEKIKEIRRQYYEANKEKIKEKSKQDRENKNEIINRIKEASIDFQTYCIIEEELKTKNGWSKEEFYKIYPTIKFNREEYKYYQDFKEKFYQNKYVYIKHLIVIKRAEGKCTDCKELPIEKRQLATEVHHLTNPYTNPRIALADFNLVPLCRDHHQKRTEERINQYKKRKIRFN